MSYTAPLSPTPRSTPTRKPQRYADDRAALHAVLDAALLAHVGLVLNGSVVVLPTAYGRDGETLYLHGSTGSPNVRTAAEGSELCLSVSLLDGIVYARSLNDHSMNFRSAVVHGRARTVPEAEKLHALRVLSEHLSPGSWDYARKPSRKELNATIVLALDLGEASVKVRSGDPSLAAPDRDASSVWAGVLPVHTAFGEPVSAAYVPAEVPAPEHVRRRGTGRTVRSPSR